MSTGTEIVGDALARIGASSPVKPANPETLETARKTLNSYIAQLQDENVEFGAVPIKALGDELSEPLGLTDIIKDNLAVRLIPLITGTQLSNQLRVNANIGGAYMKRHWRTTVIPGQVVRDTMPKGSGNRRNTRIFDEIFFNKGDTLGS